jgi:hypothetical protein
MDFLSSKTNHRFQLKQSSNWLTGNYHATFQRMTAEGYMDGNQFRLRCSWRKPGNQLVYIFIGTLEQGKISGDVHLGEYRTARFTATRSQRPLPNRRFIVPGGPPLAT